MHFHWQNLNDDETRPRWGGGKRHGRAWLRLFERDSPRRSGIGINWEWSLLWDAACGVSVSFKRQDGVGVMLHLALPWLFSVYLTLTDGPFAWLARKMLPTRTRDRYTGQFQTDYGDRELFNLYWFGWAFWWNFWRDPMGGWSNRDPKWRHGSFHPADFFFGSTKVTDREVSRTEVSIPMPERAYAATVVIEDRVWRRPRWPFAWHRHLGAHVHMERDPIPHPGKGENSWDCGEDATYSSSFRVPRERYTDAVSYAIGVVVASALNDRRKYGGRDWRPKKDHRPKTPPDLRVAR